MSKKADKHDSSRPKGGRLARRARSFKEDFLGKINQIRTPISGRAASPHKNSKGRSKDSSLDSVGQCDLESPSRDVKLIESHEHQMENALRYFKDSVTKGALVLLPGSASAVLESVLQLVSHLKQHFVNDQSSVLISSTNQVYQSLSNLIQWADNVLLHKEHATMEGVAEVVDSLQDSAKALVQLYIKKLQSKEQKGNHATPTTPNGLYNSKLENAHRNSLPDIPLTPREKQILESTRIPEIGKEGAQVGPLFHSTSSDSILSCGNKGDYPPPKPPLPPSHLTSTPSSHDKENSFALEPVPPLPPKKKTSGCFHGSNLLDPSCSPFSSFSEWHSTSPPTSSPLSHSEASSLDSSLHHSADDLLNMTESPSLMNTLNAFHHKISYQAFSYSTCMTSVSDSTDQLLTHVNHSSSSNHISSIQQISSINAGGSVFDKSVSSFSHQFLDHHVTSSQLRTDDLMSLVTNGLSSGSNGGGESKPALPAKQRPAKNRTPSQYDNVPDTNELKENWSTSDISHSTEEKFNHAPTCPHHMCPSPTSILSLEDNKPPPLPPKKKTIVAYMQTFGSYVQPEPTELFRHSMQTIKYQAQYQVNVSVSGFGMDDLHTSTSFPAIAQFEIIAPPPALPPKKNRSSSIGPQEAPLLPSTPQLAIEGSAGPTSPWTPNKTTTLAFDAEYGDTTLDEHDVTKYLTFNENDEAVGSLRGGPVDALIVHATKSSADKNYLYQEIFLTTYRTFVAPMDLVKKLIYRYNKFIHNTDLRQRSARNSFSLLVMVVDDLCISDVKEPLLKILMDFTHQLVSRGDLSLARALRMKVVEKCEARQRSEVSSPPLSDMNVTTHKGTLLDFKSELLAEQMTLLDAELFQKIEIPEVLIWAKEQKEDGCENLTRFTEHFNKMSYWARSVILQTSENKDREKVVIKFIKIMKHLRKINNFNSYLAILSALDSAPIRRLEWQRNITEGLKEYCALIDSSSSFRAYRQALSETEPPCIPYIGLILQDLTFVHVGNSDFLSDGIINFTKHWQQYHILEPMRRFRKRSFNFKRNEQVIDFFNNFEDSLSEEAMWQISENIKPRGAPKKKD